MSHLGERITDYVFEELSSTELAEARAHVAQCGECKMAVEHFQRTRSLLQAVPDLDPPRSAALVFERPRATRSWAWRWLAPMGVAAALVLAFVLVGPVQVQWHDSQLTIAFGSAPVEKPQVAEQQAAATIEDLRQAMKYVVDTQRLQEQKIDEHGASIQVLAQRSPTIGD